MTPAQAITLIENVKREAPDQLVATCNTVALEAARWAYQAVARDQKLYAEIKALKAMFAEALKALGIENADAVTEPAAAAEAAEANGAEAVDTDNLKGDDLEKFMDQATNGMSAHPSAPGPAPVNPFAPTQAAESEQEPLVVVPAAAAKAKARAAQTNGPAPKA